MEQSAQKLLAQRLRAEVAQLIATTKAMPEDRLRWRPLDSGRCVLELLADCVHCNWRVAKIIRNRSFDGLPEAPPWETTGLEAFHALLLDSTEKYIEVLLAVPDAELDDEFDAPWGKIVVGDGLYHPFWNMVYHEGQVNYIQILYGDRDMHF